MSTRISPFSGRLCLPKTRIKICLPFALHATANAVGRKVIIVVIELVDTEILRNDPSRWDWILPFIWPSLLWRYSSSCLWSYFWLSRATDAFILSHQGYLKNNIEEEKKNKKTFWLCTAFSLWKRILLERLLNLNFQCSCSRFLWTMRITKP